MISWASVFAHNLAEQFFWPLILLSMVAIGIGVHAFWIRLGDYDIQAKLDAKWRQWTCAQGLVIAWVIWGLLGAVPQPGFLIKTVMVPQIVYRDRLYRYETAYQTCRHDIGDAYLKSDADRLCHDRAVTALNPEVKLIVRQVTVTKPDPYLNIFTTCMGDTRVEPNVLADRTKLCHAQAMQVRTTVPQR
jgi:hypothetical protein